MSTQTINRILYRYSTSHLAKKDLVRFFYALKGRDGKSGILKSTGAEFLAKGVLLVPQQKSPELDDFFALWKVPVKKKRSGLIYRYSTKGLVKKDLVRFYYALKGRDGKSGILKSTSVEFLAKGVLLAPKESPEINEFFALWKVPTRKRRILLENEK